MSKRQGTPRQLKWLRIKSFAILNCFMCLILFSPTSYSDISQGDQQTPPFYLPTNGDICWDCERSYSPNVYYSYLEDFFHNKENNTYTKAQIIESVEHLISKELSDVAIFIGKIRGSAEADFSEVHRKIEGLKVLSSVLGSHYGPWAEKIVKDALESGMKICAFNALGELCSEEEYSSKECNTNCYKLSFNEIIGFSNDIKNIVQIHASLLNPSEIAEKIASKAACKEREDRAEKVAPPVSTEQFCGILKSKKIIDTFATGKILAYVGFEDNSYACKKVGLFFKKNARTSRAEPDPDRSFLVYPDGHREDLSDAQVTQIINSIYRR